MVIATVVCYIDCVGCVCHDVRRRPGKVTRSFSGHSSRKPGNQKLWPSAADMLCIALAFTIYGCPFILSEGPCSVLCSLPFCTIYRPAKVMLWCTDANASFNEMCYYLMSVNGPDDDTDMCTGTAARPHATHYARWWPCCSFWVWLSQVWRRPGFADGALGVISEFGAFSYNPHPSVTLMARAVRR